MKNNNLEQKRSPNSQKYTDKILKIKNRNGPSPFLSPSNKEDDRSKMMKREIQERRKEMQR